MPRDGSGNYSLPAGNPVVPGTLIEASWANSTMEDIAIALTNSLSRNGNGGMLAPLGFIDGAVNAPGMYFNSQVNMGLYRNSLNDLRIVMDGASVAQFTPAFVNMQVPDLQVQGVSVLTSAGGTTGDITADSIKIVGDQQYSIDLDRPSTSPASFVIRNDDSGVRYNTTSTGGAIQQTNAAGAVEDNWITFTRNGGVNIYHNNNSKLQSVGAGIDITGDLAVSGEIEGGDLILGGVIVVDSNSQTLAALDRAGAGAADFRVTNTEGGALLRTDGGSAILYQTSAAGATQDQWINCTQNGSVTLYFNNGSKLNTTNGGINVTGTAVVDGFTCSGNATISGTLNAGTTTVGTITTGTIQAGGSTVNCGTINSGAINAAAISGDTLVTASTDEIQIDSDRNSAGPAQWKLRNSEGGVTVRVDSGGFSLRQLSGAGALEDIWVNADGNGAVTLYHNGSAKFATESGGAQCTGTLQATGDVQAGVSDIRCKDILTWINPRKCLNAISNWGVIRYVEKPMHDDANTETPQIGLIAQQLFHDFPELTCPAPFDLGPDGESKSGEDYLTAKYERTAAILVGAVQALQMDLEKANRDIAKLRGDYP